MRITLTRALAGHAKGATIDRNEQVARHLIAAGAATETEQQAPKATAKDATASDDDQQTRRSQSRTPARPAKGRGKRAGQGVEQTFEQGGGGPQPSGAPTAG